jgi:RNA polymerase sigma factor (sigma-70 family)
MSTDDRKSGRPESLRQPHRRLALTFEAFHDTYHKQWLRYAHLHAGTRSAAIEIVQQTSLQLVAAWPHALRQESVPHYAWTVLKEQLAGWLPAHGRPVALTETAAFDAVSRALRDFQEGVAVLEEKIGLFSAISRLPERQRDVIVLRYAIGYDNGQVAELLGLRESTVRSHVSHAKRKLAAELGVADRPVSQE